MDANPDVRQALSGERGEVRHKAWAHLVRWGLREGRPGVGDRARSLIARVDATRPPAPPERLITRVHGVGDPESFHGVGRNVALDLYLTLEGLQPPFTPSRILDFGCGCARVTRFIQVLFPGSSIRGCDIDREAIAWCTEHGPGLAFDATGDLPPLPYAAGSFDFIFGISVFTHLPEDMQRSWLSELRRITSKGGYLALSVQGPHLIRPHLNPEQRDALESRGFFYHPYGSTDGLPEYYQAAWHSEDYVRRTWAEFFRIVAFVPAGINSHQDLVVCQVP